MNRQNFNVLSVNECTNTNTIFVIPYLRSLSKNLDRNFILTGTIWMKLMYLTLVFYADFKTLMQQNLILRALVTDVLSDVKEIKQTLIEQLRDNKQESVSSSLFTLPGTNFPINEEEEFQNLEKILDNENDFKNAVTELSKLGGSSSYDFIKRALSLIMTNDYALRYSWMGRKGKKPFCHLNISKVLIRSVEQAGLCKSQKETETAIQNWLRRASDRKSFLIKKKE
ncbi:hypothetical protein RN001_009532 [Aquatica leii]|uniref:DUF4806 domain-containing protein n=1 Tax=Aquatica leii TaxID=1421715 RepID=A0AAN7P8W1_9COLE|nr:hypothetical protein RN001_009532 [Aquatica leii]